MYEVNYARGGLEVPCGDHKIEFKFERAVIKKGSTIVLASSLLLGLLILSALGYSFWSTRKSNKE